MKKYRLFALLISVIMLFTTVSFPANALEASTTLSMLESTAQTYVENFARTIYLYESPSLTQGTLLEDSYSFGEKSSVLSTQTLTLFETEHSIEKLQENLSIFKTTAEYLKYVRSTQKIYRTNFSIETTIVDSRIKEDSAIVQLFTYVTFNYLDDPQQAAAGDNYIVSFSKSNNKWLIVDVWSEEISVGGYEDILTTFESRMSRFNSQMSQQKNQNISSAQTNEEQVALQATVESDCGVYNSVRAVAYAYTYTKPNHNGSNVSAYMNGSYYDFSNDGGNCTNFVSQCLFAGFGGNNDSSTISSPQYPQHVSSTGWYYRNSGVYSSSWVAADDFKSYTDGITSNSDAGMVCVKKTIDTDETFSDHNLTTSALIGAVLIVKNQSHAVIITDATGLTYDKVKFCANSIMRQGFLLQDTDYIQYVMYYIKPSYMIEDQSCGSYSSHNFITGCCRCTRCSYTTLTVWGNMTKPIPVNTTRSVTGTANIQCFRMAIGITDPSGNTTWHEALSTDVILKTYTFSQRGLYKITVAARDLNPEDPMTSQDTHIFTIRVY